MGQVEDERGEYPSIEEREFGRAPPHAGDEVAELAVESEKRPLLRSKDEGGALVLLFVAVPQFLIGGPLHTTLGAVLVAVGLGRLLRLLVPRLALRRAARATWPEAPELWYGPWDADGRARPVHVRRERSRWAPWVRPALAGVAISGLIALNPGAPETIATLLAGYGFLWTWGWWSSEWARAVRLVTTPLPECPGARVRWSLEAVTGAPLIELHDARLRVLRREAAAKPRAGRVRVTADRPLRSPLPESIAGDQVIELEVDLPDDQPGSRYSLASARWWELVITGSRSGRRVQWFFLLPVFEPAECVADQAPEQAVGNR